MMNAIDQHAPGGGRALHPWLIVLDLTPGIILTLADSTVMTITVQKIIRELGGSVVSVSWVMNGYNLTLTVLFLTMGRLGDRYGHKLVFTLGLALFTAASLPCALATSVHALVAWRVVQALGAAAVVPTALALLLQAFPESRQGFAAGLFGALSSLAAAAGPVLGGVLVWYWGWPAVFWLNLPLGALGVILALTLMRGLHTPRTRAALDWPGVALVSAGLFSLTLAIIQGNDWGWSSGVVVGLFVGGASLLAVWIWWELRTTSPLFDLRLFSDRTFAAASTAIMTVDTAMMGTMFMLVIFMIAMMDYSELRAGLAIAILPVAVMVLTPPAGWLTDRIGPRWPAVIGALLGAAGLFALGHMARTDPLSGVLWRSALVGAGSGMLNTARQLGFLLGVAIIVAVFTHTMGIAVNRSADAGQALTRAQDGISAPVKDRLLKELDKIRTIDATSGMDQIRKVAHPIAEDIGAQVGLVEGFVLLQLKNRLEEKLWDEVSAAFTWPFYTAGIFALLGALAGALLPRRLPRRSAP